jgi:predicted transcriptional regulator of viral defense system
MNSNLKTHLKTWLDTLSAQGRFSFTKKEASTALGTTPVALKLSLLRQIKAGVLAKPRSGFYLLVDPAHRSLGCLPPEWFISDLMSYLRLPYYVGGLSAAAIHGASHHAVQEMQVIIPKERTGLTPITCGKVRIRFMRKAGFECAQSTDHKAPTGYFKVSDPATTAWDLVFFNKSTGGLDHVAAVLRDLAEVLDPKKLKRAVRAHGGGLTARRLGYIFQFLKKKDLALACKLPGRFPLRLLDPGSKAGRKIDAFWNLVINRRLDPDA